MNGTRRTEKKEEGNRPNSMGFRTWRLPDRASSSVNEASSQVNSDSLRSNASITQVSCGEEWEKMQVVSPCLSGMIQAENPYGDDFGAACKGGPMTGHPGPRTAGAAESPAPCTRGPAKAKTGFLSIRTASVSPGDSLDLEPLSLTDSTCTTDPPSPAPAGSPCAPVVRRRKATVISTTARLSYSAGEGATRTGPTQFRHSFAGEGEGERSWRRSGPDSSQLQSSRQGTVPSWAHQAVPVKAANSFLFLNKPLIVTLDVSRSVREGIHRSTLSLHLASSPAHTVTPQGSGKVEGSERPRRPRRPLSCFGTFGGPGDESESLGLPAGAGDAPRPLSWGLPPTGSCLSRTEAAGYAPLPREETLLFRSDFREAPPAVGNAQAPQAGQPGRTACGEEGVRPGPYHAGRAGSVSEPHCPFHRGSSRPGSYVDPEGRTSKCLTLREALELFRPDFIRRSQGRVKELEERARQRRSAQGSSLVLESTRGHRRRKFTKPHPLSDNLFKPRERAISGREMQLRSRRIYNRLPEVTRRREEERKKGVSQANRQRAEHFNKKLLDQILQRN